MFIASKYPILDAKLFAFDIERDSSYNRCVNYSFICLKLDFGRDENGCQKVGFITNLHFPVYGSNPDPNGMSYDYLDLKGLTKHADYLLKNHKEFEETRTKPGELVCFSVIGGDFNIGNNLSKGIQSSLLYYELLVVPF